MSIAFLKYSGGYNVGDPPLPIPNREVKPNGADGTASQWESRTPPFLRSVRERGGIGSHPPPRKKKVKERVSNPRLSPFLFSLSPKIILLFSLFLFLLFLSSLLFRATASKCKRLIINHSFEYILYL